MAKQADNTFEANNIESSGSGVYRLTFAITLNKEFTFEEHSTAHIFSEAEFVDAVYTGNAVSFKVNVDKELYKSQVEHAFVEYRHKSNPNLVFVDSENVFLNDKYLFKRVLVDKDHPAGDYDIYIGIIDQSLEKPVIKKLDTYVDKKSKSEAKEQFITKQSYLPNKVIETQFPPEIDYTSQITPQVLVSVAAQIFLLYWYVQKGFSSKILLLSPAVAFFWLFWTQINIMQAFAVMIVGVPYLVVVLWM